MSLRDALQTMLGADALTNDQGILEASEARSIKLLHDHGLLFCEATEDVIDQIVNVPPCSHAIARSAYYLGLQIGWRAAQRLR